MDDLSRETQNKSSDLSILSITSCKRLIEKICKENGTTTPDGRPLFQYYVNDAAFLVLRDRLVERLDLIIGGRANDHVCAAFVLWATIHIREHLTKKLIYEFLFDGLGLTPPSLPHKIETDLIRRGLDWWGRHVGQRDNGDHSYLQTLMAEGGLPILRLGQGESFARTLTGLVHDIEARPNAPADILTDCARDRLRTFPQVYANNPDYVEIMRKLGQELCRLRTRLPPNQPARSILQWLDAHDPGWTGRLPLPLSPSAAAQFVSDALITPRRKTSNPAVAWRELWRSEADATWRAFCVVGMRGKLGGSILPDGAQGKILHLEIEAPSWPTAIQMSAMPVEGMQGDGGGWDVTRRDKKRLQLLPLDVAATISAWADGKPVGMGEMVSALPDGPGFWAPCMEKDTKDRTPAEIGSRLEYIGSRGVTPRTCVWLVAPAKSTPVLGEGVRLLSGPEALEAGSGEAGARMWCLAGQGRVNVGGQNLCVRTEVTQGSGETLRLSPSGRRLMGWRCARTGAPVWLGDPLIWFQQGINAAIPLSASRSEARTPEVSFTLGRKHFNVIATAMAQGETLARITFYRLPKSLKITVRERGEGVAECAVSGLENDAHAQWSVMLESGESSIPLPLTQGAGCARVTSQAECPAALRLRIVDTLSGQGIEITTPWPSAHPFLAGEDRRLMRGQQIFISQLGQFRAIGPANKSLYLWVSGEWQKGMIPLCSPAPLSAQTIFLRQLIAQDTRALDGELTLSLSAEGVSSPVVHVRRYAKMISQWNGLGIMDAVQLPEHEHAEIMAVELNGQLSHNICRKINVATGATAFLPGRELPANREWMIYVTLDGEPYRPFFWPVQPALEQISGTTRSTRIRYFATKWEERLDAAPLTEWRVRWRIIQLASGTGDTDGPDGVHATAGDAGALDEVQALAAVPAAALCLMLLVSEREINDVAALNEAAPLFWPCVAVTEFGRAINAAYRIRLDYIMAQARVASDETGGKGQESEVLVDVDLFHDEVAQWLAQRIARVVKRFPELRLHWGKGLIDSDLIDSGLFNTVLTHVMNDVQLFLPTDADTTHAFRNSVEKTASVHDVACDGTKTESKLWNLAQDCARNLAQANRDDDNAREVPRVSIPANAPRPDWQALFPGGAIPGHGFGSDDLVQAPYIAALVALGHGAALSPENRLSLQAALLFLSSFDSVYFNAALPHALATLSVPQS